MKKFKSQNAKGKVTSTFAKATVDKLQNSKLVLVLMELGPLTMLRMPANGLAVSGGLPECVWLARLIDG
jgi:hypothetical protein